MNINPINNNEKTFQAKFNPFRKIKKEYLDLFEEKTKDYPNLTLQQKDISHMDNDCFTLFDGNNDVAHGKFWFTRQGFEKMEDYVNRLVEILETLNNERYPQMHIDYIPQKAKWEA